MKIGKRPVAIGVVLFVAALHFVIGPNYSGPFKTFVAGYLLNILVPFAYFLLATSTPLFIKSRTIIAATIFLVGCLVETLQYYDIPIFGRTFDPLDYAMYGLGVLLGMVVDTLISRTASAAES